jgi:outer membrane protein assembly factor BamB
MSANPSNHLIAARMPMTLLVMAGVLSAGVLMVVNASAEDWPQWRGVNRDATIDDSSIPSKLPPGQIPVLWSVPVGPGYSGPTIADGRVYLTDRQGDDRNTTERIMCFDRTDGSVLWKREYPVQYAIGYQASGPRASVTVHGDSAFAIGGMGMFHCVDAQTGDVIWKRDLNREYDINMPVWGITVAPIVVNDLVMQVVAGAESACVVAFDIQTGTERWRAIDEKAGYSAPVLIRQGDQDVLVCWTGESITGLAPSTGKVHWSIPMPSRNMPIGVATPAVEGDKLFVSSFYDGSMLIQLDLENPVAKKLWHRIGVDERNTDALHCMISSPVIKNGYIYGADSYGEMRCLDMATGDRIWEDLTVVPKARWATVHIIRNQDREIIQNDHTPFYRIELTADDLVIFRPRDAKKALSKKIKIPAWAEERARQNAANKGWDYHALEAEWRAFANNPEDVGAAFVGFCKQKEALR